jgi:2,3,4,5-tetrahydropyridine-2-carboxylate N-succinyltransferase
MSDDLLAALESGRRRAAWPDGSAPGGWRVDASVKEEILALFRTPEHRSWELDGAFAFRDRATLPIRGPGESVRIVPGGTTVRAGAHLGEGVVVMPPSYVNIGAWVGRDSMVDSHVLVGSCAQIGERVHLAAGVQVGGVLEPIGARPVIVEDDVFVGGLCGLFEGVLVGRGAVLGAGVILTGTSRLYDLEEERVVTGTREEPLAVPPGAVVVPGVRAAGGEFAAAQGLGVATALIVKQRDARTDARTALESALR